MESMGRTLLFLGGIVCVIGFLLIVGSRLGMGKLPGDISFQRGNFTFYFPIATSIIVSVLLTLILNILFRR